MSASIEITRDGDKVFGGYLATPGSGSGPGLLLLQEIYGTNDDIRALADDYARAGYVVFAPDIFFWRKGQDVTFAYADKELARDAFVEIGGEPQVVADIPLALAAFREHLGEEVPVGLIGFGIGAILGFKLVTAGTLDIDAAVAFFPARLALDQADGVSQPWLFHFPENDAVAVAGLYQDTTAALADNDQVEIEFYPGIGHGFAVRGRPEYDPDAAAQAYDRSVAFLDGALEGARATAA